MKTSYSAILILNLFSLLLTEPYHLKSNKMIRKQKRKKGWQRLTLPPCGSTISAKGLNFSVRNGKRWDTLAIVTNISWGLSILLSKKPVFLLFLLYLLVSSHLTLLYYFLWQTEVVVKENRETHSHVTSSFDSLS